MAVVVVYDYDFELWWLGALIYVTGCIMINLGSNLIRFSHEAIKFLAENERPPVYKRFWWDIGFLIFGLGNLFNFCGFMFGAQSMLVALGSIQFISNVIFANFINDEQITIRSVIGTMIIICGDVIAVMYGSKTNNTYSLSELYALLFDTVFVIYCIILIIAVIILQVLYYVCKFRAENGSSNSFIIAFIPFSYAAVSAMIGTASVTQGKALAGIVSDTIEKETLTQLMTIWPYFIFLLFILFTIYWLYRMNQALKHYDALFIIPTLQALWLLFAILGGGIYFQEYKSMSWQEICIFFVGMAILLCGVAVLSPRVKNNIDMKTMNEEELLPLIDNDHNVSPSSSSSLEHMQFD